MNRILNYIKYILFYSNISPSLIFTKKTIYIKKIHYFEKTFLLRTMTKSGSHYLLSIIGNYILRKYLKKKNRTSILDLRNNLWNNNLHKINKFNYLDKINKFEYKQFWWLHDFESMRYHYLKCKKVINLYRNPFDCLVSNYYYFYKNRNIDLEISKYIDYYMPKYIQSFKIIDKFKNKKNIMNISYEELIKNTESTIKKILLFLNLEINKDLIRIAISDSSMDNLQLEEKNNLKNLISNDVNISFIRNRSLKSNINELSHSDIEKIKKYLNKSNIIFKENNFKI